MNDDGSSSSGSNAKKDGARSSKFPRLAFSKPRSTGSGNRADLQAIKKPNTSNPFSAKRTVKSSPDLLKQEEPLFSDGLRDDAEPEISSRSKQAGSFSKALEPISLKEKLKNRIIASSSNLKKGISSMSVVIKDRAAMVKDSLNVVMTDARTALTKPRDLMVTQDDEAKNDNLSLKSVEDENKVNAVRLADEEATEKSNSEKSQSAEIPVSDEKEAAQSKRNKRKKRTDQPKVLQNVKLRALCATLRSCSCLSASNVVNIEPETVSYLENSQSVSYEEAEEKENEQSENQDDSDSSEQLHIDPEIFESVFSPSTPNLVVPTRLLEMVQIYRLSGISSQYFFITNEPHKDTFNTCNLRVNAKKNRYSDIICYDTTRVVLDPETKTENADYINANHVNGYKQKKAYICCQGPLKDTTGDFWQMVWQEDVRVIVMTTRLMEKGRTKCHPYWPVELGNVDYNIPYSVANVEMESSDAYTITTLNIIHISTKRTRVVYHLLFLNWPDYGVPSSAEDFLNFLYVARYCQAISTKSISNIWRGHPRGPPMIVHCSAGVGRSGSFICADICMRMLDDIQLVNIQSVVRLIRSQRAFAVQTVEQYIFCHTVILEYAKRLGLIPEDVDTATLLTT